MSVIYGILGIFIVKGWGHKIDDGVVVAKTRIAP